MNDYEILKDLTKLCEYMYRRGIYDSALCGDIYTVNEVADREDGEFMTYQFLNGMMYESNKVGWEHYADEIILIAGRLMANHFRAFMRHKRGENALKKEMLFLIDRFYRKGLRHGLKRHKNDAIDFFEDVKYGAKHPCYLGGSSYSMSQYIDMMQHIANTIQRERNECGYSEVTTNTLTRFIGRAVRSNFDKK